MEEAVSVFSLVCSLVFFLIWEGVPILICYVLTKKMNLPKLWCIFGLFGMFGIVLLVIMGVSRKGKQAHSDYQGGDMDYQANYENNRDYHAEAEHWHNITEEVKKTGSLDSVNIANWQLAQSCEKKEDVVYVNGERVEREYVICKSCGGKMRKGTNFCTYCGKDL